MAATAEAKEASAPDAVVADVAPKVSAGGRYSDAAVAAMTEDQLWTAVSAGLLTSGQMTRALQQFGFEATTPKGYQALLLQQALEGSRAAAAEAARVKAQAETAAVRGVFRRGRGCRSHA